VGARVCVTGGLGFLGSRLCAVLAKDGYEVVSIDRLSAAHAPGTGGEAAEALAINGVEVIVEDLNHAELDRMLDGADAIVHLAALPGVRTRHRYSDLWRNNVLLTERLVAHASRHEQRIVFASSSSVYGNAALQPTPEHAPRAPLSPYAASKLAAENACLHAAERHGADVVIARLFTAFGPGQRPDMAIARWIDATRRGEPIAWHVHTAGARELTHVDDVARGLRAALERGRASEAYNIAGCGPRRLDEVLALIERELGRSARLQRSDPPASDPIRTAACQLKSALELRYRPAISLTQGIRSQIRASAARAPQPPTLIAT
jgi:UDP-glucuronate 4-epimerase